MLASRDELLPSHFTGVGIPMAEDQSEAKESSIEAAEMMHIKGVKDQCGGDTSAAARILGISRTT